MNVPLRTQIYRSVCKGNWNLLADEDTMYATGYCGIRKYYVDKNGSVSLLKENESFAKNRIIGHGLAISKDRLFLACRSYLAGPLTNDKAKHEGELIVLDRNLNKCSEFFLPSKMNDAELLCLPVSIGFIFLMFQNQIFLNCYLSINHQIIWNIKVVLYGMTRVKGMLQ